MEGEERKVVVDASVAVKWFIEEEYTREALMLRDSYREGLVDLIAPLFSPTRSTPSNTPEPSGRTSLRRSLIF
ncbi:MAG: hypothetical protein GSR85_00550 [Desulfurococcales archaeon]|nr:hypothetical protein [Desulfurococcales archaeon]